MIIARLLDFCSANRSSISSSISSSSNNNNNSINHLSKGTQSTAKHFTNFTIAFRQALFRMSSKRAIASGNGNRSVHNSFFFLTKAELSENGDRPRKNPT
eukprot:3258056-Amphidinium_carterae.1